MSAVLCDAHIKRPAPLARPGHGTGGTSSDARHTLQPFDPLRDKSYQRTRLGRDVVDWLAWLAINPKIAARTLDTYERALARGCLMFPRVSLEQWGISEMAHVAASFTPKQRRTRVAAWRSFFGWAIKMDMVEKNPCDKLPEMEQHDLAPVDEFDDAEIERLTGLDRVDGVLMQLLFDGGLRKTEAASFQAHQFRLDELPGQLHVLGKGSKWRVIPCTLVLAQRLDELITLEGLKPTDHLWYRLGPNGRGLYRDRQLGSTAMHHWWGRCLEQAGVRYRHLHVTRHTHATRYLRRQGSLSVLSSNLGHASTKTTERYTHLSISDRAAEMARLFDEVRA